MSSALILYLGSYSSHQHQMCSQELKGNNLLNTISQKNKICTFYVFLRNSKLFLQQRNPYSPTDTTTHSTIVLSAFSFSEGSNSHNGIK